MACLLTAGDGCDEQRALRWKAAHKVPEIKLASLVHGGGEQELGSLLDFGRVGIKQGGEGLEAREKVVGGVFYATLHPSRFVWCYCPL